MLIRTGSTLHRMKTPSPTPQNVRTPDAAPATPGVPAPAAQPAQPSEFSGWYLSSVELRQGLTVVHLDDLPPRAMFS
jgi:hypothetical protein